MMIHQTLFHNDRTEPMAVHSPMFVYASIQLKVFNKKSFSLMQLLQNDCVGRLLFFSFAFREERKKENHRLSFFSLH